MSTTPERTTGSSGSTELQQLVSRLDELQRRHDAFSAALDRARRTRRLIMIAFLAFVVIAGWRFYALANTIRSGDYQDRLINELGKAVTANQNDFAREAEKLVKDITPVVSQALSEQSKKDLPLFMQVIDEERQTVMTGLPKRLSDRVEKHHRELLRRHEKLIQTEFPAVQDSEVRDRMMGNVCLALDRLVKKYYVDEYKKEFQRMSDAWDAFPRAEVPGVGDPGLDEQLMGELMDLVAVKLARHRAATSK